MCVILESGIRGQFSDVFTAPFEYSMLSALYIVIASLAASSFAVAPLVINTPAEVVQCQPTEITWEGGVAPYDLVITDVSLAESETTFALIGHSFRWPTDLPGRTLVDFAISDGSGQTATSALVLIQESADSSCL
ncbi:hypothetical protein OH77DRAFT_1588693 [Trametes cingulata]|nr:hypothetical protein OH77DRAFT_1588693 [Trametes cingulata]